MDLQHIFSKKKASKTELSIKLVLVRYFAHHHTQHTGVVVNFFHYPELTNSCHQINSHCFVISLRKTLSSLNPPESYLSNKVLNYFPKPQNRVLLPKRRNEIS